jgi:beta-galactosidase beta subunit
LDGKRPSDGYYVEFARLLHEYHADISFYNGEGKYYILDPGTYLIAFIHMRLRPGLAVDGKETEKKVVIKVRTGHP